MKSLSLALIRIALLAGVLSLAACGAGTGGTSTGGASTGGASSTAPTAMPKPKPTTPPPITAAYCQSIMTVAQANQIMNPPVQATTINAQSSPEVGVCRYDPPQAQFAIVKILIDEKAYTGPKPVPEATIAQLVSQLESSPGATITTTTPVSGVGDQAEFLAASVSESGMSFYVDAFYVIYGNVAFMCDDFHMNTKPDDATQQNELQQCAEQVVNRLNS
ncbi:MAG TPA: hypothetical protein VF792_07770 [Ktedonobacterales bacterium]